MEELFNILLSRTRVLTDLGFETLNIKYPKGSSFSIDWQHTTLPISFGITWDRMEMFITSCKVGECSSFRWFYQTLNDFNIQYSLEKLAYPLTRAKQLDKDLFTKTLDYNLKKLGELLIVIS